MHRSITTVIGAATLIFALGCQGTSTETTAGAEAQPEPPPVVTGWTCETPAACFGHAVGRVRTFERKVGDRRKEEQWTLTEKLPEGETVVMHQEGGPERYVLSGESLAMSLRGELLEVLHFPVVEGARHEVTAASGARVEMQVRTLQASVSTPAGSFDACFVHEAHFVHDEASEASGLRVETTFCEGYGEVVQKIHLSGVPHPIEFSLVKVEGPQLAEVVAEP